MLDNETITQLKKELSVFIDLKSYPVPISFIEHDHILVNKQYMASPCEPKIEMLVVNNPQSLTEIYPPNTFTVSRVLRPNEAAVSSYFNRQRSMGAKKLFIKPFMNNGQPSIVDAYPSGGLIIQIIEVYGFDDVKLIDE